MQLIAKGTALSTDEPQLVFFGVNAGWLVDVAELSFQIWSGTTQVYPVSGRQTVDLVADRLGKGRYAATWSVPGGQTSGRYEIRWFYRLTLAGEELRARERFEIVSAYSDLGPFLAGPLDLSLDESVTATEARLIQAIGEASRAIEAFTRNVFAPVFREFTMGGGGSDLLQLPLTISAIESVTVDGESVDSDVLVYNRHLAGMVEDRGNPKLERKLSRWPKRSQCIVVRGLFGHLEAGLAPWGSPRGLATKAAKLLALLELNTMGSSDREDLRNRYRVISESTRDQAHSMSPLSSSTGGLPYFVGDPEIDTLIAQLRAPIQVLTT